MTVKNRFGSDALPYHNTASFSTPTWVLLASVREVTSKAQFAQAPANVKGTNWKQQEPTFLDLDLEITVLDDEGDTTGLKILRDAFYAGTVLDIGLCSGTQSVAGEDLLHAEYKVFGFEKAEPWEDFSTYKFTLKPCKGTNAPAHSTTT